MKRSVLAALLAAFATCATLESRSLIKSSKPNSPIPKAPTIDTSLAARAASIWCSARKARSVSASRKLRKG